MLPPPPPPPQGHLGLPPCHRTTSQRTWKSVHPSWPSIPSSSSGPKLCLLCPLLSSRPAPGSSCCPPPSSPASALSQTHTQISPGFKKRKPRMPRAIWLWPLCVPHLPSQAALSLVSTRPGPSGVDMASSIPGDQHPSRRQDRPHPLLGSLPETETLHHLSPWHRSKHKRVA